MKPVVMTLGDICTKGSSNLAQKDLDGNSGEYEIYGASGLIKKVNFFHQEKPYIAVVKDGAGVGRTMLLPAKTSVIGTMQYIIPNEDIDIEYLYYAITYMDLSRYYMGAAIPHIYFKDYCKEKILIPDIDIQKAIAHKFRIIDGLITARQEQLAKLDELIASRFIEMFGEIGTDKFGWGLFKIGDLCIINPKKSDDTRLSSELDVSFVPMPAVSEHGDIDTSETRKYDEVKTGFTYFADDDVLFAKITPCMENGKGCVARHLCNGIGFGSTEFHVLRPTNKVNSVWVYAVTSFPKFREDAANNMTGSAGQRRVPAVFLEHYKITLPPIELQEQFAAFVEQTDKSKVAVQKSLEQLETLKKSLMQKYFG